MDIWAVGYTYAIKDPIVRRGSRGRKKKGKAMESKNTDLTI